MENQIDKFLDYMRIERNYSEHTEINYLNDLESFNDYLKKHKIDYKKLTYKEISEYTRYLSSEKKDKSTSINRHLSAIRSFYNYLLREKIVTDNPLNLIKGPKNAARLPNYMKYNEFEVMIDTCDNTPLGIRNKCILELLLATGSRISEVINMKLSDIDFKNKEIKVLGKGNKERICYFNEHCSNALYDYINNARNTLLKDKKSNYLFINHIGGNLTDRGVRDILDNIIKKSSLRIKVTPHTFRHTFATMLLNEGCDLKSVQELLGHVNLSTTSIYTHLSNERIKSVYFHTHPRNKK